MCRLLFYFPLEYLSTGALKHYDIIDKLLGGWKCNCVICVFAATVSVMMDSRLTIAMFALFCCVVTASAFRLIESERSDGASSVDEEEFDVSKRRLASPACRACIQRRDYVSCTMCYSRSGNAPYVGVYKRGNSGVETVDADWSSALAEAGARERYNTVEKRAAFIACYCCTALLDRECCWRCGYPAYYGKRSAGMSLVEDDVGEGGCDCCLRESFDYDCCLSCRKRK